MPYELYHNTKAQQAREADGSGLAVSATVTGAAVDCSDFHVCTFVIDIGDNNGNAFDGTNNLTFKVQEGDLADSSDMADIVAGDYLAAKDSTGAAWDKILDEAAGDNKTYQIGIRLNTHRYKRVVCTMAGTITTVPLTIVALLGSPRHHPV